jgi:hypothetical protein
MKKLLLASFITTSLALTACGSINDTVPEKTEAQPIIVTQDNFPQAYTNLRFAALLSKTGGVNKLLEMPVPSSDPDKQFVVRMNRVTFYTVAVVD